MAEKTIRPADEVLVNLLKLRQSLETEIYANDPDARIFIWKINSCLYGDKYVERLPAVSDPK